MKITVFNGSPKGEAGNTNVMVTAFLAGAEEAGAEIENIFLANKVINHCKGCMSCIASGGECVIKDDMGDLITKYVESDIVVFATPLFIDNISGMLKVFMDRTLCIGNPYYEKDENGECRGAKSKRSKNGLPPKIVVISNCGYAERSNFQVISLLMKRFTRQFHMDLIAEIYTTEGTLFALVKAGLKQFEPILAPYKELLHKAGMEVVTKQKLSEETQKKLEKEFIPVEDYFQLMNKLAEMTSPNP